MRQSAGNSHLLKSHQCRDLICAPYLLHSNCKFSGVLEPSLGVNSSGWRCAVHFALTGEYLLVWNKKIILDDTFWWCFLLLIRCLHFVTVLWGSVHILAFRIYMKWQGISGHQGDPSLPMAPRSWCNFAVIRQGTIAVKSGCHFKWRGSHGRPVICRYLELRFPSTILESKDVNGTLLLKIKIAEPCSSYEQMFGYTKIKAFLNPKKKNAAPVPF